MSDVFSYSPDEDLKAPPTQPEPPPAQPTLATSPAAPLAAPSFSYTPGEDNTHYDFGLSQVELLGKTSVRALLNAGASITQEEGHQIAAMGHILNYIDAGQAIVDTGTAIEKSAREEIAGRNQATQAEIFNPSDELAANLGGALGTMLPALATRSPAGAAMVIGYLTGQESRNNALDKGMGDLAAIGHGSAQALIAGGAALLPMGKLFQDTGFIQKWIGSTLVGLPTWEVATVLQAAEDQVVMEPNKTLGDFMNELPKKLAMTAAMVPLMELGSAGAVSFAQKAKQVRATYDALVQQEQQKMATGEVKNQQRADFQNKMNQLLDEAGTAEDQNAADTVITYHGSPSGQLNKFDDTQVGKRDLGPEAPASDLRNTRAAGHFTSESKGFASMWTRGPNSKEEITDVPLPPTSTVDVEPPPALLNVRDFLAKNAPLSAPPIEEPPEVQQPGPAAVRLKAQLAPIYEKWGAWQNGDLNIHILDDHHQLPDELHNKLKQIGDSNAAGFYDNANNIYLFADRIDPQNAEPFLLHESFGHFGMNQVVPNWDRLVPSVIQAAPTIMPDAWKYVQEHYADQPNFNARIAAKETLAVFAQMHPNESNTFIDQIWSNLRNWTRSMGFKVDVTRNDVVALLQKSREGVERGTLRGPIPGSAPLASRSNWDPTIRRWGEALFGHSEFPIIEKADPNPAEREPIYTGKSFIARVYHGSKYGDRTSFDPNMLGKYTGADSASLAHFFAGRGRNAEEYAGERPSAFQGINTLVTEDRFPVIEALLSQSKYSAVIDRGVTRIFNAETQRFMKDPFRFLSSQDTKPSEVIRRLVSADFNGLPVKQQVEKLNQILGREPRFEAPTTFPVYVAMKNPLVIERAGGYEDRPFVSALMYAENTGHDGVVWLGIRDPHFDNIYAVLKGNENQIRSVNAKFDTSNTSSPNLLAARAKVNIARINPTTYLDLEKRLVDQNPKVLDALRKAGIMPSSLTGQEMYDALVKTQGGKREASDWLDKNGIPGATYREAFRPKGQKEQLVRNYITFKGENASILSAEGQQVLAEEKARQQELQRDSINERMKHPPELNARKRIELLGKAISVPRDTLAKMRDEATVWNKFLEYATGIEEIAAVNPQLVPLQIYTDSVRSLWGEKGKWSTAANEQVRRWRKHISPGQQSEHFDALMDEAGQASETLGRALTPIELDQLIKDKGLTTLGENELKFAQSVWDDYREVFKAMSAAVEIDINNKIQNEGDRNARQADRVKKFARIIDSNFFPKSNFGEYPVEFRARKDGTIYNGREYKAKELVHYSTYSSKDDALKALRNLQDTEFPSQDYQEQLHLILSNRSQEFMGVPPSLYKDLMENARDNFESSADLAELEAHIERLQQENSSVSRTMRRVLRETKAYGYDTNSMRVYAHFMQRFANQLAKMRYGPNMQAAIDSLGPVVGDNTKRDQIRQYMRDHRKYIINPGNELTWLRSFGFNFYIGAVVKSAAVNLTQVPMVTLPHLAQMHGIIGATKAIAKNMDAYFAKAKDPKIKFPPEKLAMFQELMQRGMLNESFANELAAVAEGATFEDMTGLHNQTARNIDRVTHAITDKFAFLFHHAEGINRFITAGAAYDLARQAKMSHEKAVNEAMRVVQRTQGEYARYNRPKAAWGKKSAAFLFMRFTSHMMWYIGYQPAKWGVLSMWALAGGLMGLPFAENIADLIDAAGTQWHKRVGSKEPLVQARQSLLRFLENQRSAMGHYGDFMPSPDLIMHGMSRAIPIPFSNGDSVDVSQSIGLGRPIPGTQELLSGDLGTAALKSLGAVAEIPINIYDAATSDNPDMWKRAESVLPMSLRNISAATRWLTRGNETNAAGQVIQEFDPSTDLSPIIAKGLGFPSTEVNRARELDYLQRSTVQFYASWKEEILKRASAAYARGNVEDQKVAREEVLNFNKRVPYIEMGISSQALQESILGKARTDALHAMGYPSQVKPYARLYNDVREVNERAR